MPAKRSRTPAPSRRKTPRCPDPSAPPPAPPRSAFRSPGSGSARSCGCSTPPPPPAAECPECSARSAYPAARPAAQGRRRARHSQIAAGRPFRPAILTSYNTACSQNASGFSPAGSPLPAASARHPCWWPAPRCCPARQTGRTGTRSPAASRQRWRRSCPVKRLVRLSDRPVQLDSREETARRSGSTASAPAATPPRPAGRPAPCAPDIAAARCAERSVFAFPSVPHAPYGIEQLFRLRHARRPQFCPDIFDVLGHGGVIRCAVNAKNRFVNLLLGKGLPDV